LQEQALCHAQQTLGNREETGAPVKKPEDWKAKPDPRRFNAPFPGRYATACTPGRFYFT
jgi:hypothetical protein